MKAFQAGCIPEGGSGSPTLQTEANNWESGGNYGSLALLCFASVALLTASFAPWLSSWLRSKYHDVGWQRYIWYVSQLVYTTILVGVLVVRSAAGLVVVVAMAGMSWAVTQWVPFTLINVEILDCDEGSGISGSERAALLQSLGNVAISVPQMMASCLGIVVFSFSGNCGDGSVELGTKVMIGASCSASLLAATLLLDLDGEK